jgi:hypothetical protein
MSNDFYNGGSVPAPGAPGASNTMRNEFAAIAAAFDKMPVLDVSTANNLVVVNGAGTALETTATFTGLNFASSTISGGTIDGAVIGGTTPGAGAFTSLTVNGVTVVLESGTQTLTGKTINLASNTLVATSAQMAAAVTDETGTGALVFANSPALTGVPTVPTATPGTNTTQIASTAFVTAAAFAATLPLQTGNADRFITTDGTSASWAFVPLTSGVTGTLPVANGGSGATSLTGVVKGNGTSAFTAGAVNLTSEVTGALPVGNGGTGATTLTANNVILGNGTSAPLFVAPGASGNLLMSDGTTWTSAALSDFDNDTLWRGHQRLTIANAPNVGDFTEEIRTDPGNVLMATRVTLFDTPNPGEITQTIQFGSGPVTTVVTVFDVPVVGGATQTIS